MPSIELVRFSDDRNGDGDSLHSSLSAAPNSTGVTRLKALQPTPDETSTPEAHPTIDLSLYFFLLRSMHPQLLWSARSRDGLTPAKLTSLAATPMK